MKKQSILPHGSWPELLRRYNAKSDKPINMRRLRYLLLEADDLTALELADELRAESVATRKKAKRLKYRIGLQ